mgnify:CR=1 FL=1
MPQHMMSKKILIDYKKTIVGQETKLGKTNLYMRLVLPRVNILI